MICRRDKPLPAIPFAIVEGDPSSLGVGRKIQSRGGVRFRSLKKLLPAFEGKAKRKPPFLEILRLNKNR